MRYSWLLSGLFSLPRLYPSIRRRTFLLILLFASFTLTNVTEAEAQRRVGRRQATSSRANIFEEAQRQANSFWGARVTKCGEDFYSRLPNGNIIQYRGVSISVSPSTLSEADALNGVQFRGTIAFDYRLNREFFVREKRWRPWRGVGSESMFYKNRITKQGGRWNIEEPANYSASDTKKPIACAELNDPAGSALRHAERRQQAAVEGEVAGFLAERNQRGFISNNLTDRMWRSLADVAKNGWIYRAAIYSKERYVFARGQSRQMTYRDVPDEVLRLINEGYDPSSLVFAPNGGWVIFKDTPAPNYYGAIRTAAWSNVSDGLYKSLQKCVEENQNVELLRFTPDGNWIIVIRYYDDPLKPWNYRTTLPENHVLRVFLNTLKDTDSVSDISFFPNGGYVTIYNGNGYASDSIPDEVLGSVEELRNRPSGCPINVSVGFDGTWLVYFSCFRGRP